MDSFFQSLVMAPFFVFLEVLFFFGFRPKFRAQLQAEVDRRCKAWKGKGKGE